MSKNIVVVGSSNTDMILKMKRIPRAGETLIGGNFSMAQGGKGANQAVSAARAGANVTLIARVGKDMFGEQAIKSFIQDGINVQNVIKDDKAPSGIALIFVDDIGENSIGVASGVNANLSPSDIENAKNVILRSDMMLMQLETPLDTVRTAAQIASSHRVPVILNPAPAQSLDDNLLKNVSILTPNETEAEILTGVEVKDEKSIAECAASLRSKGVKTVLITLSAKGVYVDSFEFTGLVPGFRVSAVDTTAAGDVFNGALAVAIAENRSLNDSAKFACAAAALACCKLGAQASAPSRKEIERFLQENG
jgi:ribokinase